MLRATQLGYSVGGARLVQGVDFTLAAGETLAIVGPNGAGKTTLLRLLAGELPPTEGTLEWEGRPATSVPLHERARRRAVLPQQSALSFDFEVLEVVLLGRMPHGRSESPRDLAIAHEALTAVGAEGLAGRRYPTLSGGERQRVQLARALAQIWEPPPGGKGRLLLLDEPTSALDVGHQQQILSLARGFAAHGVAIVAVLHDLNLAARGFDRVLLMERGRPRAHAPAAEVLTPAGIEQAFGLPVHVLPHPDDGGPLVVPREPDTLLHREDRRSDHHDDCHRAALHA